MGATADISTGLPLAEAQSAAAERPVAVARWVTRYAAREWPLLATTLGVMIARVGMDLLKPWPLKILVDYVLGGSGAGAPDRPLNEISSACLPGVRQTEPPLDRIRREHRELGERLRLPGKDQGKSALHLAKNPIGADG